MSCLFPLIRPQQPLNWEGQLLMDLDPVAHTNLSFCGCITFDCCNF